MAGPIIEMYYLAIISERIRSLAKVSQSSLYLQSEQLPIRFSILHTLKMSIDTHISYRLLPKYPAQIFNDNTLNYIETYSFGWIITRHTFFCIIRHSDNLAYEGETFASANVAKAPLLPIASASMVFLPNQFITVSMAPAESSCVKRIAKRLLGLEQAT